MDNALELDGIDVGFGNKKLLSGVNLSLAPGEVCCLRTGVLDGATSLLKVCAGLLPPLAGRIRVDGQSPHEQEADWLFRKLAYCYEQGGLISIFSNYNNILFPVRYHLSIELEELDQRIQSVCQALGIADELNDEPQQLNDVQLRLFNLARAMVIRPSVLLVDELQSGMSLTQRSQINQTLKSYVARHRCALLMTVTAGDDESLADTVAVIEDGTLKMESA